MTRNVTDTAITKFEREFNTKETVQLLSSHGAIFWSWGAKNFTNLANKALIFKVNGHHHKGYVLITLAWNDTYSVYMLTTHGKIISEYKEVYCDMLVEVIDNRIEKIPDYTF